MSVAEAVSFDKTNELTQQVKKKVIDGRTWFLWSPIVTLRRPNAYCDSTKSERLLWLYEDRTPIVTLQRPNAYCDSTKAKALIYFLQILR